MKYKIGEIKYFKPNYNEEIKECWICQLVKYIEKSNRYLAIIHDIYAPYHYMKGGVKEEDLGETFIDKMNIGITKSII